MWFNKTMPRSARVDIGGEIYHVINRANGRLQIFNTDEDYKLFEQLLLETKEIFDMRILAYELMPNHFHLVLYPKNDGDLGLFMHRLCNAHTRKVHAHTNTNGSGHLYQGRYKSFQLPDDYLNWINIREESETLDIIRISVKKGEPYGKEKWIDKMVSKY